MIHRGILIITYKWVDCLDGYARKRGAIRRKKTKIQKNQFLCVFTFLNSSLRSPRSLRLVFIFFIDFEKTDKVESDNSAGK
jgi:hypothetical protein